MTPCGTTYITAGSHGFYYRETISSSGCVGSSPSLQDVVGTGSPEEKIGKANILEFVDSSNAALINRLNERARMVNPALFLYIVGAAFLIWGLFLIVSVTDALQTPPLPDATTPLSAGRRVNKIDEYSLLLARYGQPNTVIVTSSQSVPLRIAVYNFADLGVVFVPNGCVDAYDFHESHKENVNASSASSNVRYSRSHRPKAAEKAPICVLPQNNGSTIVRYQNAETGSPIGVEVAQQRLDAISSKSSSQPTLTRGIDSTAKRGRPHNSSTPLLEVLSIHFNQETLRAEEERLREIEAGHQRGRKHGFGLLFSGIGLLVGGGFLHKNNSLRRTTRLVYELNETARQNQKVLEQSLKHLAKCQMIWRVVAKSPTYDWKRNAGASHLVLRARASIHSSVPPRVESNVAVSCINLGATKLYFLPDTVLYWDGCTFESVSYDELALEQRPTQFIEDEQVPGDARQVDKTWQYVREDGGPDRRFNNNVRFPVMQYGAIAITSSKGLNILLNASNVEATAAFVDCVLEFKAKTTPGSSETLERVSTSHINALKVLGLESGASVDKISEAYRSLAQMYHPDKVAGLAPEFHEIAERRMKEINAAYHLLKRQA